MEQQKFIEKIESIEIPCRYSLLCDEISQCIITILLHEDFLKGLCMRIITVLNVVQTTEGNKQNVSRRNLQKYANS